MFMPDFETWDFQSAKGWDFTSLAEKLVQQWQCVYPAQLGFQPWLPQEKAPAWMEVFSREAIQKMRYDTPTE